MSEGDSDSSIPDYMLFGNGFLPDTSRTENGDNKRECVPQKDEVLGHYSPSTQMVKAISSKYGHHKSENSVSDSETYCIKRNKSKMQISPVGSDVLCENYRSPPLPVLRDNEAFDVHNILNNDKCDADNESTQRWEKQLMTEGEHSDETCTFSLGTEKYEHFGKTDINSLSKEYNEKKLAQKPCQNEVLISEINLRPTKESIQGLERDLFNCSTKHHPTPEIENGVEPQSFNLFYTCQAELQNGDQLSTSNNFKTCVSDGDMKNSDVASNIPQERKVDSSFIKCDNLLISHGSEEGENTDCIIHMSSLDDGRISNHSKHVLTKEAKAASSMDGSSLNADSLYDDDFPPDLDVDYVADNGDDIAEDSEACVKVKTHVTTKDNTVTVNALKGGTDEKSRILDLTSKIQDDKKMTNIFYSFNKSNEKLEDSLLANTSNGLHSDKSIAEDVTAETQVKEFSDNYEMSILNEDYVELLNKDEKEMNRSSNLCGQNLFSYPNSVVSTRTHPNLPDLSFSCDLEDIRNVGIESSQSIFKHKPNSTLLRSPNIVDQSMQLKDTNYAYPEKNGYTFQKYNLLDASQQEVSRLLVQDTEGSMNGLFGSNTVIPRNGKSEESIIYELANEFSHVRVEACNACDRLTDLSANQDELSDPNLFGGPEENSLHQTGDIEGTSFTAHLHNIENSSMFPEISPSADETLNVHTASLFLMHPSVYETPGVLVADLSYQENDISGEISVPVQEAHSQSSSYEPLHRDQERPSFVRQISCPLPQSESRSISCDDFEQRDSEMARELQQQFNHEILMGDESLHNDQERPSFLRQISCPLPQSENNSFNCDELEQRDLEFALELQRQLNQETLEQDEAYARSIDNNQYQELSPSGTNSRRTEFFGPRDVEMININPQRRQQRQQHRSRLPGRQRTESAANIDRQSDREQTTEDIISIHENRWHTVHSHESSQRNLQGEMQQRGDVAGANVADSRMPSNSAFQNLRPRSGRAPNNNNPVSHRFEPDPEERFERIPGQTAQIDPNVITPLTLNYQAGRRQDEEQRRQSEARLWRHQYHYLPQNWSRGLDLLPNDGYPSLDVPPSYFDPDEVFEHEDGDQYVSITRDPFTLMRLVRTRRPSFEIPAQDSYNELWNLVEMLGEVRQQGLDQTHIERLPVHTFNEGNSVHSKECNICLSAYNNGDEIRTLTCLHMFHTICIDEWLNRNAVCPVCRRRIEMEDSSQ